MMVRILSLAGSSVSRCLRSAAAAAAAMALLAGGAGCQSDSLQIVRAPFVSPVIVPAPVEFRMNVAVKNFGDEAHGPCYLRMYCEYFKTPSSPTPCTWEAFEAVPALEPGESWSLTDYRIDRGDRECPAVKDQSRGHIWLSLVWAPVNGPPLPGPNTDLHVTWAASGDLADMTVTD